MAAEAQLAQDSVPFQAEGRLLQELGERLVASPDVALVELVKNAYDADSPSCAIRFDDKTNGLTIQDSGNGMTLDEFLTRWMRIATSHKIAERESPKYHRPLTGQKGIGRFAVRFLGRSLRLDTVAWDKARRCKTRLVANFDWQNIDKAQDIGTVRIPYRLTKAPAGEHTGTTLSIGELKTGRDFITGSPFRTSVLRIVSPIEGLERGRFVRFRRGKQDSGDPGFVVTLPGTGDLGQDEINLADEILRHSWARLTIDLDDNRLTYRVTFGDHGKQRTLRLRRKSPISKGLLADIRFFPRRAGLFRGTGVDGRKAWTWVRENHGVSVVDHGFRMKPLWL